MAAPRTSIPNFDPAPSDETRVLSLSLPLATASAALILAFSLSSAQPLRSQLALPAADPATALQALQQANTEMIKRQEATLKELEELTATAREVRIFSKRG